jgi:hypothetical protein
MQVMSVGNNQPQKPIGAATGSQTLAYLHGARREMNLANQMMRDAGGWRIMVSI